MKTIPRYVLNNLYLHTTRRFKQTKRKCLDHAIRILYTQVLPGAAYCPRTEEGETALDLLHKLEALRESWTVKKWGR